MTPYEFDGSRTELGSRIAVGVAAVAASILGVTAGYPLQTAVGVVGGLAFGAAARDVAGDGLRERVRGSTLLVAASVLVVVALGLPKRNPVDVLVLSTLSLAVGATALAATTRIDDVEMTLLSALGRSVAITVLGTLLAGALYADVFGAGAVALWSGFEAGLAATPLFGLVALQFEFLLLGVLVTLAGHAAAELDPEQREPAREGFGLRDVPRVVWAFLAIEVIVLTFPGGPALFEFVLSLAGPIGALFAAVLSSPLLHAVLLAFACVLAVLPAVRVVRKTAVSVVGSRPPKSFALATGGFAFSAVVVVLTSLPYVSEVVLWLFRGNDAATRAFEVNGVGPVVLATVTGALVTMAVVVFFVAAATGLSFVPERATGFAFAGVALFVAATAGAIANVPAPAVFVGMAAAVVTWDVGEYATSLGEEMGAAASTRPVTVVHAIGSIAVGVLAVVVASLATHFLVPLMTNVSRGRAMTALGLLSVAILAFAYLANTASDGESDDASSEEHGNRFGRL